MYFTFRPLDELEVKPYSAEEKVKTGDVVAFTAPNKLKRIAHRVVRFESDYIITQADNAFAPDPWRIQSGMLIGRVISVNRQGKKILLLGGRLGKLWGEFMRSVNHGRYLLRRMRYFLRPWAAWITRRCCLHTINHREFKMLIFQRGNQRSQVLIWKGGIIARRMMGETLWKVRFPFQFFVNQRSLFHLTDAAEISKESDNKISLENK